MKRFKIIKKESEKKDKKHSIKFTLDEELSYKKINFGFVKELWGGYVDKNYIRCDSNDYFEQLKERDFIEVDIKEVAKYNEYHIFGDEVVKKASNQQVKIELPVKK